jgi:hypothetical protein
MGKLKMKKILKTDLFAELIEVPQTQWIRVYLWQNQKLVEGRAFPNRKEAFSYYKNLR